MDQWEAMAPRWERGRRLLWRGDRGVSERLVWQLEPEAGQRILELAAGTGDTGFLAAERLGPAGRLITSDRAPGMLAAAKRLAAEIGVANVEFRQLDATAIDLPEASVDGVLCRFGHVLRGDPPAPLREIRRVLRPGGRLAFAVWATRERNPWMTVAADAMVERGHLVPSDTEVSRLSARRVPETIARLLAEAGFGEPAIVEVPVRYTFADADELWFFVSELRVPRALAGLEPAERDEIRAAVEARSGAPDGGYELAGVSLCVVTS